MTTIALIMAAGRGTRMQSDLPKQYLPLDGKPVLRHTVEAFLNHPRIDQVAIVISADDTRLYEMALGDLAVIGPISGGATRQESVLCGLTAVQQHQPEAILIHDAARPLVTASVIDAVCTGLQHCDAVLPCLRITDTLKRGEDGIVTGTIDRDTVFRAQTPQGFRFASILNAHQSAIGQELTDDIAVAERAGITARMVDGDEQNLKITTANDLIRAQQILKNASAPDAQQPTRIATGQGFDVHRFADDRKLILCGIEIPHDQGLAGHSDADVALHAITDAILGAISAGDIGQHFPPSDPQWQGAASDAFLRHACELVQKQGGRISHLDLTIICERPKIGQHRDAMQESVARICALPLHKVSIKATTTEKLGFTGRKEGIASMATATIELPDIDT